MLRSQLPFEDNDDHPSEEEDHAGDQKEQRSQIQAKHMHDDSTAYDNQDKARCHCKEKPRHATHPLRGEKEHEPNAEYRSAIAADPSERFEAQPTDETSIAGDERDAGDRLGDIRRGQSNERRKDRRLQEAMGGGRPNDLASDGSLPQTSRARLFIDRLTVYNQGRANVQAPQTAAARLCGPSPPSALSEPDDPYQCAASAPGTSSMRASILWMPIFPRFAAFSRSSARAISRATSKSEATNM
jgi:hypothetical protein